MQIIAMLTFVCHFVMAASAQTDSVRNDDFAMPSYVRLMADSTSQSSLHLPDSLFYSIARGVVFPVNVYKLNMSDPFIRELSTSVLPQARRRGLIMAGIDVRGAASPDGPYEGNVVLAQRRVQSIIEFLTSQLGQTAAEVTRVNSTPEDYDRLLMLMRQANDPDAPLVAELMTQHDGNVKALKRALQKARGGALWQKMLQAYFPQLRSARLVVYFRRRKHLQMEPLRLLAMESPERIAPLELPLAKLDTGMADTLSLIERRHVLAVSTNLLYDGFYMPNYGWAPSPNIELEYYPHENCRWTYLAAFTFPYYHRWSKHKFFQLRDYHVEARRYFRRNRLHNGTFVAAYLNANIYGIGFSKQKGWEGEGAGAALKIGHVWRLSRSGRWRIELSAAVGGYLTRFDPYVYGNPVTGQEDDKYYYDYNGLVKDFHKRNHQRVWIGPTDVGLKIRYDLLYKRVQKRGVSFKRKEVVR